MLFAAAGGDNQGGNKANARPNEATWRAAAGSAAWIRDQLPEILRLDPDAVPGDQLQQLPEILDVQQVDPDAAAGARERPSEAPERLRADKYQGGGTQGGNEATWRAAAGSAAGSVISCRRSSAWIRT